MDSESASIPRRAATSAVAANGTVRRLQQDAAFDLGPVLLFVQNSGTCNWDSTYRLKLVGGDTMNAAPEQTLYPARANSQATIRILFTAPYLAGTYKSSWQAFAPDGAPFGDSLFIEVIVQ